MQLLSLSKLLQAVLDAFPAPTAQADPGEMTPEVKERISVMLIRMGSATSRGPLDTYIKGLQQIAREYGKSMETVQEIASEMVEELEPRIQAVLPMMAAHTGFDIERRVRHYIHTGTAEERRMHMAYVEEKAAEIQKKIHAMYDAKFIERALRRYMGRKYNSPGYRVQFSILESDINAYRDPILAEIWYDGPAEAEQKFQDECDYYESYLIPYDERLKLRARRNALDKKASGKDGKKERVQSTSRRAREIKTRRAEKGVEIAPVARQASLAPGDMLNKLLDETRTEHANLQNSRDERLSELEIMHADIRQLHDEAEFERELALEYQEKLGAAINDRGTLAASIAALDAQAFSDGRADELEALRSKKLPESIILSVESEAVADAPEVKDQNNDIVAYLMSPDADLREPAQAIAALRAEMLPLERQWRQLGSQIDQLSFQRSYIQKQTEAHRKDIARMDTLLTALAIEQAEMEFLMQDIQDGNRTERVELSQYPKTLDSLSDWANDHFKGRLIITKKALRAAAGSTYHRPEHVYAALELLGNQFWAQKNAGADQGKVDSARAAFMRGASDLYLTQGGSITSMRHNIMDEYKATHQGETHFMDMHLARGVSRNHRYSMRIYYTWSPKHNAVIVGHLPGHLSNSYD